MNATEQHLVEYQRLMREAHVRLKAGVLLLEDGNPEGAMERSEEAAKMLRDAATEKVFVMNAIHRPAGEPIMAAVGRSFDAAVEQMNDPKNRDSILRSVETDN